MIEKRKFKVYAGDGYKIVRQLNLLRCSVKHKSGLEGRYFIFDYPNLKSVTEEEYNSCKYEIGFTEEEFNVMNNNKREDAGEALESMELYQVKYIPYFKAMVTAFNNGYIFKYEDEGVVFVPKEIWVF